MKYITKIIAAITSAAASLIAMACDREEPKCVYGPPEYFEPNHNNNAVKPNKTKAPAANRNLPQSNNDAMGDLYGPPAYFGFEEEETPDIEEETPDIEEKTPDIEEKTPDIEKEKAEDKPAPTPVRPVIKGNKGKSDPPPAPIYGMPPVQR